MTEQQLQRAVADLLTVILPPDVLWTSIGHGGGGRLRGAILRGCGLRPGVPDMLFVHRGIAHFVELKASKGSLSLAQRATVKSLAAAGAHWTVSRSVEEVVSALDQWGIPHRSMRLVGVPRPEAADLLDRVAG